MKTVNIYEAKTQLSRLVEQAAAGEDVVIARAGRPVARTRSSRRMPFAKSGTIRTMPNTTAFRFGDLVPFPFSDQTGFKKRTAIVVSSDAYQSASGPM